MGGSKLNTIQDPLGQQKTAAANLGLQNYQTASSAVPSLQNYFNQNYGQSAQQTLGNMDPLFQQTYGAVSGDVTGQGGPFTSLNKNLLGAFDQQANQAQAAQNAQLQSEGIYSSGLGMGANNNLQSNLATQRGALSAQNTVNELNMADTLSGQLMSQNQLMGQVDPLTALQQVQSLSTPPNMGNVDNSYYTPGNATGQIWNDIMGLGLFQPQTGGNPSAISTPGASSGNIGNLMPNLSNLMGQGQQGIQSILSALGLGGGGAAGGIGTVGASGATLSPTLASIMGSGGGGAASLASLAALA